MLKEIRIKPTIIILLNILCGLVRPFIKVSSFRVHRFVSVEEKKRLGTIKENEVLVQRKKEVLINNQTQTVTVPFRIVDQPLKLQQNEWYVISLNLKT